MKYAIYEGNLDRLEKKLKRIFNKCKAYGCDFHYEQTGEEFRELKDEKGNKYTARFVLVEAEGTAVINDWEFVAELEHTEKGNIITGVAGIEVPERYYTTTPVCEHCNSKRYRKNTYIVRNKTTGEFKQVGKSCLKDFTHGMSAEAVTQYMSLFDTLIEGETPEALKLQTQQGIEVMFGNQLDSIDNTASTEIKNLQTEVEGLKTQVGDRDKQLETLKASAGDNADLKKKIEDLQTENATAKATHESELNQLKIDFAVEKALTGAKAKNIKAVKALLELGEAKLDKDGNVKGLDEQIEKLRSGDDTKFLFEAQKQQKQQQNFKGFQPGASGEKKPGEGETVDFSKMSYDELTAYMEANPDAQI